MTAASDVKTVGPAYDVAILGAGFSGSLVAIHLAKRDPGPSIVLLEKSHVHGGGLAYGAAGHRHLLNVPAGRMSAFPDQPDHFLQWLRERPNEAADFGVVRVEPGSFLPRRLYGRYLTSLVADAAQRSARLHLADAEALDLIPQEDGTFAIALAGGAVLRARSVVLAAGNFPPKSPPGLDPALTADRRYVPSPWGPAAAETLEAGGDILVLGTGLTALDLLSSVGERKRTGHIHLISRHGLLPAPHQLVPSPSVNFNWQPLPTKVGALVRRVRHEVARAAALGVDWRAVIDSLRPVTQEIWRQLPMEERRRFLRHVRPYWEVARHRAAPEIMRGVAELREAWRLTVHCGRLQRLVVQPDGIEVYFQPRCASGANRLLVSAVVNCTGPETDLRSVSAPLISRLISRGLVLPDRLGLGLEVSPEGQAIDTHGRLTAPLFATGALRKGLLWETTAVPELRQQAADLADLLFQRWDPSRVDQTFIPLNVLPRLEQVWAYEI